MHQTASHSSPIFQHLMALGCLSQEDLHATQDGFMMTSRSVADILAAKGISSLSDFGAEPLPCQFFYDDWYMFAVGTAPVWGLIKMREQEFDAVKQPKADGDIPGVTVSFIDFQIHTLMDCLQNPVPEAQSALRKELNRVTAARGQNHHPDLKAYFVSPQSQAPYLIAEQYCQKIARTAKDGQIPLPELYIKLSKSSFPGKQRLPRFIEQNNRDAAYTVCDQKVIFIQDQNNLSRYEQLAILATHTGNVSFHSFAAEIAYHARFLVPMAKLRVPLIGWSIYSSAIRADMSIDASSLEAFAPFYFLGSPLVRQYAKYHDNQ